MESTYRHNCYTSTTETKHNDCPEAKTGSKIPRIYLPIICFKLNDVRKRCVGWNLWLWHRQIGRVHVDAMRIITGATVRSNIANRYEKTKFMTFKSICNNATLNMMHKTVHNNSPRYLHDLLPRTIEETPYNLRNKSDIATPCLRLDCLNRSFFHVGTALWNNIPSNARNAPSVEEFRRYLQKGHNCPNPIFYEGGRHIAIHHACMRIGCSKLKHDLHNNLHVVETSNCHCGAIDEDAS